MLGFDAAVQDAIISKVHASSVNMFKNKIDKYLAKAGYT